jgi:hypothetical protein
MKIQLLIPVSGCFALAFLLQSCAVSSTLVDSREITITHEHRVNLPAALYSPGTSNTPMFEQKGDLSLSVNMTKSGENTNDDSNPNGDPKNITEGITHQDISKAKTFTVNAGYALSDDIGLTANFTTGSRRDEYYAYIESWNLTQDIYNYEYWAGIPLTWEHWIGGTWYSTETIQAINDYQKVGKKLTRSYRYFDGEVAVGKYAHKNKIKTGLYGGLGFAQNQTEGHMDRGTMKDAYGRHNASFFKVFVLPSAAFRAGWFELGAALKGSYMHYKLRESSFGDRSYAADAENLFFVEPSLFFRFGPHAFRINVEQKWLSSLGKSPFPVNNAFTSVGVISMLNTKKATPKK